MRAHGLLSPDEIAEALAERLGLEIDPLDDDAPPDSERILEAAKTGVLRRIDSDGRARITVVPRGNGIARLAAAPQQPVPPRPAAPAQQQKKDKKGSE